MSLDLLKEFGYDPKQAIEQNPWQDIHSQKPAAQAVYSNDDDFGDFERPEDGKPVQQNGLDATSARLVDLEGPSSSSGNVADPGYQRDEPLPRRSDVISDGGEHLEEEWGDFVDQAPDVTRREQTDGATSTSHQGLTHLELVAAPMSQSCPPANSRLKEPTDGSSTARVLPISQASPPSNIPPPSVLLLLSATLLQSLPAEMKQLTAFMVHSDVQPAISGRSSLSRLAECLSSLRAVARIMAGRKVRWKRDNHLAQSMRIGPAQTGKGGGMKLTGVDRTESRREDQEAAEVVRLWKQHVGSLRASIVSINARHPETQFILPDLAENLPVRSAKASEGALTAPKSCVLCGLRRDERVQKVDLSVEDSFGEWWSDHWGHNDCQAFWEGNKDSLRQR